MIQLHAFSYSIGGFLSTIITTPFYKAEQSVDCFNNASNSGLFSEDIEINGNFHIPYNISGVYAVISALPLLLLYKIDVIKKLTVTNQDGMKVNDIKKDAAFCEMFLFFNFMMLFFGFAVGTQIMFQSNIFTFRYIGQKLLCSNLLNLCTIKILKSREIPFLLFLILTV